MTQTCPFTCRNNSPMARPIGTGRQSTMKLIWQIVAPALRIS